MDFIACKRDFEIDLAASFCPLPVCYFYAKLSQSSSGNDDVL